MNCQRIVLRRLRLPLIEPFVTAYGTESEKDVIIVEAVMESGAVGYAECAAGHAPLYTEETSGTAWHMLSEFLIPALIGGAIESVADLAAIRSTLERFRGNRMAKAAIEMALWDGFAQESGIPLASLLGASRTEIPVGVSVGIQTSTAVLVQKVRGLLEQGFARVKVKIRPGYDMEPLAALRDAFPDMALMADANSAYRLADAAHLQRLDEFNLMMIEQPFAVDDLIDHACLQKALKTPVCLDETIRCAEDVRRAARLGSCRIVNLKVGRVGGFGEALRVHEACVAEGLDLWCGGMFETGIGRLHNIALTALSGFTLPGDTAPSERYFSEDVIDPPVCFARPGWLAVEPLAGVGSRVRPERLERWTVAKKHFDRQSAVAGAAGTGVARAGTESSPLTRYARY